jgi:hypothetical protein
MLRDIQEYVTVQQIADLAAATTFTLAGDTGSPESIGNGDTLTIVGGTGIDTVVGATDTLTINLNAAVTDLTGIPSLPVSAGDYRLNYNQGTDTFTWTTSAGGGGIASLTLAGDTGSPETLSDGNTITIAGGTGIDTVVGATDTVTINLNAAFSDLSNIPALPGVAGTYHLKYTQGTDTFTFETLVISDISDLSLTSNAIPYWAGSNFADSPLNRVGANDISGNSNITLTDGTNDRLELLNDGTIVAATDYANDVAIKIGHDISGSNWPDATVAIAIARSDSSPDGSFVYSNYIGAAQDTGGGGSSLVLNARNHIMFGANGGNNFNFEMRENGEYRMYGYGSGTFDAAGGTRLLMPNSSGQIVESNIANLTAIGTFQSGHKFLVWNGSAFRAADYDDLPGAGGGGSVTAGGNGLDLDGTTIVLGQDVGEGGNPAELISNRQIPTATSTNFLLIDATNDRLGIMMSSGISSLTDAFNVTGRINLNDGSKGIGIINDMNDQYPTGTSKVFIGAGVARDAALSSSIVIGGFSGAYGDITDSVGVGTDALRSSFATGIVGIGDQAGWGQDGTNLTFVGTNAGNAPIEGTPISFADTDITTGPPSTLTLTAHGYTGTYVVGRINLVTGSYPVGISENTFYRFEITDVNTLTLDDAVNIISAPTSTLEFIPVVTTDNSTAIGYNAQVTADNQIVLGDDNITELKVNTFRVDTDQTLGASQDRYVFTYRSALNRYAALPLSSQCIRSFAASSAATRGDWTEMAWDTDDRVDTDFTANVDGSITVNRGGQLNVKVAHIMVDETGDDRNDFSIRILLNGTEVPKSRRNKFSRISGSSPVNVGISVENVPIDVVATDVIKTEYYINGYSSDPNFIADTSYIWLEFRE